MIVAPELAVFDERGQQAGKATVIVMSPDAGERDWIERSLDHQRYRAFSCSTVDEVLSALHAFQAAVVVSVCDRADTEALSLCWKVAQTSGAPVILMARRGADAIDRVFALEAGADDLLSWPPNEREFSAIVRARTRRFDRAPSGPAPKKDHWVVDGDTRSIVNTDGRRVLLSRSEWALLDIFVEHAGRVIEAGETIAALDLNVTNATVGFRMAVSRLRRKLTDIGAGELIRCVRGEGYMLDGSVSRSRGQTPTA